MPKITISQFTFGDATYAFKDAVAREALENINSFEYVVCTSANDTPYGVVWNNITGALIPSNDTKYLIYLVHSINGNNDIYDEYITIQNGNEFVWEKIGNTDIDLSSYLTSSEIESLYAKKNNSVITGSLSLGRDEYSTIGENSVAEGLLVEASGANSHAVGNSSIASGDNSYAEGYNSVASGTNAHALGSNTTASGMNSFASGSDTVANASNMVAIGQYNSPATLYSDWVAETTYNIGDRVSFYGEGFICTVANSDVNFDYDKWQSLGHNSDTLFVIGNGMYEHPSNAFEVRADGSAYLGGEQLVTVTDSNNKADKNNTTITGSLSLYRKANTTVGTASTAIGANNTASGLYSAAFGNTTTASGTSSFAIGTNTEANGVNSIAEGNYAIADGRAAHAAGEYTRANGRANFVHGRANVLNTTSIFPEWAAETEYAQYDRVKVTTESNGETVVTLYMCTTSHTSTSTFDSSKWENVTEYNDFADIVGNGRNGTDRSNAYALDWNGNAYFKGNVYAGCDDDSTGGSILPRDVQVNGVSVVQNGVATIPIAGNSFGVIKTDTARGLQMLTGVSEGYIATVPATEGQIKTAENNTYAKHRPIVPYTQHISTFYGLAKAAGDTTQSQSNNAVGTYTPEAKTAIQTMLGIDIPSFTEKQDALRVTSLTQIPVASGQIVDSVGIPVYVDDVTDYSSYGITDTGWYAFVRITAKSGVTVSAQTAVTGADGYIATSGADHVDVAVRFGVAAQSKTVTVAWNNSNTEVFVFRATDLAVRNLDYRSTFYVYDIEDFAVWTWALTTDATFASDKNYFTLANNTYTQAEVTASDPVPAYYTLADETYTQATGLFEDGVTYYTKSGDTYTEAEVTIGDPIPAYYNHTKLTFSGMIRNVTYRFNEMVDCPIEIVLPEVPDDGYGAWFEIQMQYSKQVSTTLLPTDNTVVIGTAQTQAQTAGINVIDLQYSDVNGVKIWTLLNTHSNLPTSKGT